MSLYRSSNFLRRCRLHPRPEIFLPTGSFPSPTHPTTNHYQRPASLKVQPFHTTPSHHAARAPSVHYGKRKIKKSIAFTREALFASRAVGDKVKSLEWLDTEGNNAWLHMGRLDPKGKVTLSQFKEVGRALIESAYEGVPSAEAIRSLPADPDKVWLVGQLMQTGDKTFSLWHATSCALAGVKQALCLIGMSYLTQTEGSYPMRTRILDRIEDLALRDHDRDIGAMAVHVKVLIRREQYEEAMKLLEQIIANVSPSKVPEASSINFEVSFMPDIWQEYLSLKEKLNQRGRDSSLTREEVIRMAAVDYLDARYLGTYASMMLEKGDLEAYEQSIHQAAMAGQQVACRKLANFYYLTSQGLLPRRGDKKFVPGAGVGKKENSLTEFVSTVFRGVSPLRYYHQLALQWYELSLRLGNESSAIILAILYRSAGQADTGAKYLEEAQTVPHHQKLLDELKQSWDKSDYMPEVPDELLSLHDESET
ncbi:hypothetical protein BO71DRAFT_427681 [Aspergillus ellipticus CBS 707.79]|uniref:Uncharacterized protein n=1 Tax=Aspergillus ellipticus CBS 707.79 TaxID=1448320 RepID=A0A319EY52_9EURO|nr:hypothetical protein BO71DRAFT_427681 [Aspergillus ellipticus CBS 707.79]